MTADDGRLTAVCGRWSGEEMNLEAEQALAWKEAARQIKTARTLESALFGVRERRLHKN